MTEILRSSKCELTVFVDLVITREEQGSSESTVLK